MAVSKSRVDVELCFKLLSKHYTAYLAASKASENINTWLNKVVNASPFRFEVMEEIIATDGRVIYSNFSCIGD